MSEGQDTEPDSHYALPHESIPQATCPNASLDFGGSSTGSREFGLNTADPTSILGIPRFPLVPPGVIPKYAARNNPSISGSGPKGKKNSMEPGSQAISEPG